MPGVVSRLALSWLPRTILGGCKQPLMLIRSLLLALYACWCPPCGQPTFVVSDGSPLVIPILRHCNNCIAFVSMPVSLSEPLTRLTEVRTHPLETACLRSADAVVVPSLQCASLLPCVSELKKIVVPPCYEQSDPKKYVDFKSVIFSKASLNLAQSWLSTADVLKFSLYLIS